jgi:hypothetical protein
MALYAAAARWHEGRLRGGDEGRSLTKTAETWMAGQGIAGCARMAGMLAPGFPRSGRRLWTGAGRLSPRTGSELCDGVVLGPLAVPG